jgi:serine O-acetyltransferase
LDIRRRIRESGGSDERPPSFAKSLSTLLTPQITCILFHRVSHFLHLNGWCRTARLVSWLNTALHKATITPASCIAAGWSLPHPTGVVFHGRAGVELTVYASSLCTSMTPAQWSRIEDGPTLGDRVTIGVHAAVLGPVSVGSDTTVAYRTDLMEDAPAGSVVASRSTFVSPRQITRE